MSFYETNILRDGIYLEVEVDYDYFPPERATWDYPGYPAYIDINEVYDENGKIIYLTRTEEEIMKNQVMEWLESQEIDYGGYYD